MRSLGHWSLLSSLRLLLLVCVVAGAARVYVAAEKPLNYDEYWHIFVAQQDTREGLAREWRSNAHPPLYYWLLRLLVSLARGPLVDRSISLLAGVLAVLVIGQILAKVAKDPVVAPLGAFAFALAPSAVLISSEVRSYMLCTLFLLVAFSQYVGLVKGPPSFRALVIFSGASCLALMSHYFTIFFLAAGLAAAVWMAARLERDPAGLTGGAVLRWPRRYRSWAWQHFSIAITCAAWPDRKSICLPFTITRSPGNPYFTMSSAPRGTLSTCSHRSR